jgi:hypothetical protein
MRTGTLLLALLAAQYLAWSLLTTPLYGDSPRNLHWGLLTAEQPRFLLGAPDASERIKGFPPEPPELASRGLYRNPFTGLHRWWGPVMPLLVAGVWALTGSYTLVQLIIPLAGGATVLLTYLLARRYLEPSGALLAAGFLALFPLFRDYASTGYSEALSALLITAALLAYRSGRTLATALLGALAMLGKLDLVLLYGGVVGCCTLLALARCDATLPQRHHLVALLAPPLLAAPWVWTHYLAGGGGGPTGGLSAGMFALVAPQMLQLLFFIPWYGALLAIAAIGWCAAEGARALAGRTLDQALLLSWLGLGLLVALVYAATPGAGNSPRIIIPALPPLAVLAALGFGRLQGPWRRRVALFLGGLFLVVNVVSLGYYGVQGAQLRSYGPAWDALRERPRCFVLTERYWATLLYTRQPVTWFEGDQVFQDNILNDEGNFARYVEAHPICYVILPNSGLAAPGARAYLERRAAATPAGATTLYTLPRTP